MQPKISVELGGLFLRNPVMVASGTYGYGEEFAELVDLSQLGAIVTKTITLKPRLGNKPPRIVEVPSGMLNSIGLQNVGVEAFIKQKLPFLKKFKVPLVVSIAGETEEEYIELVQKLEGEGVSCFELNLSCPNIKYGTNLMFAQNATASASLVKRVREVTNLPIFVKLSALVADITEIARACEDKGADGISLINTIPGMAIDVETRESKLGEIYGGLSGPAIKPIALRVVYEVHKAVRIPLIGMGGIMDAGDALEFIIAGANAVAVGTGNFVDPKIPLRVIEGIKAFLVEKGIRDIKELVGSLNE